MAMPCWVLEKIVELLMVRRSLPAGGNSGGYDAILPASDCQMIQRDMGGVLQLDAVLRHC